MKKLNVFSKSPIIVKTEYPIMKILAKPDLVGRIIGWVVELSEFQIQYQLRGTIKSQALADFTAKLSPRLTEDENLRWTLTVDGSSNENSCGASVVLEGLGDILLEQALKFGFKTSNNQAEYEVILADSQLVVAQLK